MARFRRDSLVVGGAGLRAAATAPRPDLSREVTRKVHPMRSRTVSGKAGAAAGGSHVLLVLRGLTGVLAAFAALLLLGLARAVAQGHEACARFLSRLAGPPLLVIGLAAFVFFLFHAVTWFDLARVARRPGRRAPDLAVAGLDYFVWVVLSIGVSALLSRIGGLH